jgi:hypothetical protein
VKIEVETLAGPVLALKSNVSDDSLKSRRDNFPGTSLEIESVPVSNKENTVRIISNPIPTNNNSGTERQRVVTPAAAKMIDDEDEPRTSPSITKTSLGSTKQDGIENDRKVSLGSTKQGGKGNDRKVLGGIENI